MNTKERIVEYLNYKGISITSMERCLGWGNGGFVKTKSISTDKTVEFLLQYPEVSPEWLLTGNGEMIKQEEKPVMNYEKGVPYYNVDFECGFSSVENDQTTTPHCLIDLEAYSKADCWCNATGKSMIPEINPGDIIALKELHDWQTYIPYGEIYAIVTTEHRTIKRICKSDVEGCVLLLPTNLNGRYSPQDIPLRIVQRIYKVIGCIKRFEQ